jgi:hypothetical protein
MTNYTLKFVSSEDSRLSRSYKSLSHYVNSVAEILYKAIPNYCHYCHTIYGDKEVKFSSALRAACYYLPHGSLTLENGVSVTTEDVYRQLNKDCGKARVFAWGGILTSASEMPYLVECLTDAINAVIRKANRKAA